jgi:hypothetical protein
MTAIPISNGLAGGLSVLPTFWVGMKIVGERQNHHLDTLSDKGDRS